MSRKVPLEEREHGTRGAYGHGCRCELCRFGRTQDELLKLRAKSLGMVMTEYRRTLGYETATEFEQAMIKEYRRVPSTQKRPEPVNL